MPRQSDHVDEVIRQWSIENAAYDLAPVAVVGRMARIMEYIDRALEENFDRFGISRASFDVLATLKRAGPPYALTQRQLTGKLLRTSGSVSVRIDALERSGFVERREDESDRRSVLVSLTKHGHEVLLHVVPEHLRTEQTLLEVLTPAERERLIGLLRKLLRSFEDSYDGAGRMPFGIKVHTPRVSLARRRSVGLSQLPGLLVADVVPKSDADKAGLRRGDFILRAGGSVTDTLPALRAALRRSAHPIALDIVRGTQTLTLKFK